MKKLIIAMLTCICTALTMSGCDALSFSVGNLLSAPSIADEQAAIHQALIDSVDSLSRRLTLAPEITAPRSYNRS